MATIEKFLRYVRLLLYLILVIWVLVLLAREAIKEEPNSLSYSRLSRQQTGK